MKIQRFGANCVPEHRLGKGGVVVKSALLCSADPSFKHNHLQILQTESAETERVALLGKKQTRKKNS